MDKNTLIGALLIGAVLIGFTWFSKPDPTQQTPPPADTTHVVAQQPAAPQATADTAALDSTGAPILAPYQQAKEEKVIVLKNEKLALSISTRGGAPVEAVLADYLDQSKKPVHLFRKGDTRLDLPLRTLDNRMVSTADANFDIIEATDSTATLRMQLDESAYLDYVYKLCSSDYRVDFTIRGHELRRFLPVNIALQDIEWRQRIPQQEQSWKFEGQYSGIYYHYPQGDVDRLETTSEASEDIQETLRWVAFKDKYFSSVLIASATGFKDNKLTLKTEGEGSGYVRSGDFKGTFPISVKETETVVPFMFFFGPNDYDLLKGYDEGVDKANALHLDHLVYLGMSVFRWINQYLIIPVVTFLSGFLSNWGIIILLMTLFIKMLLWPFTYKSYMSQAKMRVLRPQIEAINAKYPGKEQDQMMKRQTETMNLYRSAGASPMSGCLPMLLQMPFLIALYMYFPTSILLRGEGFLLAHDGLRGLGSQVRQDQHRAHQHTEVCADRVEGLCQVESPGGSRLVAHRDHQGVRGGFKDGQPGGQGEQCNQEQRIGEGLGRREEEETPDRGQSETGQQAGLEAESLVDHRSRNRQQEIGAVVGELHQRRLEDGHGEDAPEHADQHIGQVGGRAPGGEAQQEQQEWNTQLLCYQRRTLLG